MVNNLLDNQGKMLIEDIRVKEESEINLREQIIEFKMNNETLEETNKMLTELANKQETELVQLRESLIDFENTKIKLSVIYL